MGGIKQDKTSTTKEAAEIYGFRVVQYMDNIFQVSE